jgi:hypothetical protein
LSAEDETCQRVASGGEEIGGRKWGFAFVGGDRSSSGRLDSDHPWSYMRAVSEKKFEFFFFFFFFFEGMNGFRRNEGKEKRNECM